MNILPKNTCLIIIPSKWDDDTKDFWKEMVRKASLGGPLIKVYESEFVGEPYQVGELPGIPTDEEIDERVGEFEKLLRGE